VFVMKVLFFVIWFNEEMVTRRAFVHSLITLGFFKNSTISPEPTSYRIILILLLSSAFFEQTK
jgi:hypothetical protein